MAAPGWPKPDSIPESTIVHIDAIALIMAHTTVLITARSMARATGPGTNHSTAPQGIYRIYKTIVSLTEQRQLPSSSEERAAG